ncbi:hypothetical protein AYJ08_15535 [Brevibacillus sp. SKDU10]|uniref:hypothetical protein n=1 Tax=Brevibacillus sp. SKDU10 TaxID=1247872 RepID=UPI0007C8F2D1|nr:hypothetical protein [Brevibacillus sp. SKDU10]OAJ73074.1 hypothetical protein AYJ08_15535 [Brevibacillus sp. SKDU10]
MKKFATTVVTAMSVLSLLSISLPTSAYAESNPAVELKGENNQDIRVNIPDDLRGKVSEEEINAIVKQAGDASEITIHDVFEAENSTPRSTPKSNTTPSEIAPQGVFTYYDSPVLRTTRSDQPTQAIQIISVARGQTITLTSKEASKVSSQTRIKSSVTAGANTPASAASEVESQIGVEVSKEFTVQEEFKGPSEGSAYNTRVFYWTGFYDEGTWTMDERNRFTDNIVATHKGNFKKPTRWLQWSQDYK